MQTECLVEDLEMGVWAETVDHEDYWWEVYSSWRVILLWGGEMRWNGMFVSGVAGLKLLVEG